MFQGQTDGGDRVRALRILHTESADGWGGQAIRILTEAQVFIARGHHVEIAGRPGCQLAEEAARAGVRYHPVDLRKKSLSAVRAMRVVFDAVRPDLVDTHSSTDHWVAALARLGRRDRPRIVRTRHFSAPVSRNFASRWLYTRGSDGLMTTSDVITADLVAAFGRPERVTTAATGIDAARFSPGDRTEARRALGLPPDRRLIGIVAQVRRMKGHDVLLRAFARLGRPDAELVLVGDEHGRTWVRELAAELGVTDRIRYAGAQADVVPWLRAFDVAVLPSVDGEGVPQAFLQSLACGVPTVGTTVGGMAEVARGLDGVRLVAPRDVEALAGALAATLDSPPGSDLLAAARRRVEEHYSLDVMYRTVMASFTRALG